MYNLRKEKFILPCVYLILISLFSCSEQNNSPDPTNQKNKVVKIVFTEANAVTTLNFEYEKEKVKSIKGDLSVGGQSVSISEERFYLPDGSLDYLNGNRDDNKWMIRYGYENGLKHSATLIKNNASTTTVFNTYDGAYPLNISNLYGALYSSIGLRSNAANTDLKFDVTGNLILQKDNGIPNFEGVVEEKKTIYGFEKNPLISLMEAPLLSQAMQNFDDLGFYYSPNLPLSVEANYPYVDTAYNGLTFEYTKDSFGRVIQVRALNSNYNSPRYVLDISYDVQ